MIRATTISFSVLMAWTAQAAPEANLSFHLSPAGSFTASTKQINGHANKLPDGSVSAEKIEIPLDSLTTGIALRDEHMKKKYLETPKYPNAIVTEAKGKDGKGTAMLEAHGVKKKVEGTYSIDGKELVVKFPLDITQYNVGKIRYAGVGVKETAAVEARIPLE